jgi:hypothetical protein
MSWNISVYAEQHINGAWNYIMPLHDNFKWLIDYDYFENLQDLPANEFNNVSSELKAAYSESDSDDLFAFCSVKKTTPANMYSYASSLIEKSTAIKKTIWAALGLPEYTDDEYEDVLDDKYDSNGNIDPNWNPLTHPVAKELFSKLQEADFGALKGYRILGMLDALEANSDFGANIRLILVRG